MAKGTFGDITPARKKKADSVDSFIDGADTYQNRASIEEKEAEERLNVLVPKALHKSIKLKATQEETSMKELTIKALNEYLNK